MLHWFGMLYLLETYLPEHVAFIQIIVQEAVHKAPLYSFYLLASAFNLKIRCILDNFKGE